MLDRPKRDAAHYHSAFFGMESPVCDMNGATTLFLQVFRDIFDKAPNEKRDYAHVYLIDPDAVTALVYASQMLMVANAKLYGDYYAGHGERAER